MTTLRLHDNNPNILIFENVILSYPHLFKARNTAQPGQPENIIFDKNTDLNLYNKTIEPLIQKVPKNINTANIRMPIADGDKRTTIDPLYTGNMYMNCSTYPQYAPTVIDMDGETKLTAADNKIRPGCLANVMVSFSFYNNVSVGISARLHAVQYAGKGKPIGIDNDEMVKQGGFVKLQSNTNNFTNKVNYIE